MSIYAEFDREKFPLIIVTFTGEKETEETFDAYLRELEHNYVKKKPISIVFDAKQAPIPSLKYQKRQADWMKENATLIETYCKGVAYVAPTPILRAILKVVFSIQRNPVPFRVFSTRIAGAAWAQEQLNK